ncbi:MAG: FAD-dependent oxidoreductase, partial [Thermoplasmata archaeon]|nr:FAD-dependent oxidoreductase [Thermoplasmata archaeon]
KHEISLLEKLGVELKLNTPIGKKLTISALQKKGYGAIFIAVGTHISSKLRIEGEDLKGVVGAVELLRQVNLGKKVKLGAKVAVIGGGNAAIDAARTALRLGVKEVTIVYRRSRQEMPANPEEIEEAEHEGVKIHYLANPKRIIGNKGKVTQMECIKMELGAPDESGRRRPIPIEGSEFKIDVDNVIPAIGQSPDLEWLGYANPKTAEFNLTPWGTFEADEITAETNLNGIFAGGDAVTGPRSFIEALAAGRKAAISIAKYLKGEKDLTADRADIDEELAFHELGEPVVDTKNVETEPRIEPLTMPVKARAKAGNFKEVNLGLKPEQAAQEASRCLSCGGCSECMECVKVCKPEAIFHDMVDQTLEAEVGAVVIATGFDLYDKKEVGEYGYGSIPDVIDGLQFERLLSATGPTGGNVQRPSDGKVPKEVVFVQCVGSRDPELGVPYCSRICCMYTAKQALLYKHAVPDGQAYVFYIDIRSAGKGYEEFVQRAQEEEGILYLRGKVAKIFQEPGKEGEDSKVIVWGADTLTSKKVEVAADLVVLATAVVPSEGIKELASKLRVSTDEFGFVKEAHLKLRPAETLTAGIYLAGVAQSPKDITDSVAQGSATAAKILALFSNDELLQDPTISWVDEEVCAGCGNCVNICAYSAVELDDKKNIAKINDALCEGCGACAAVCPSGAMQHKNYSKRQVMDMIDVVTEEYGGI